MTDTKIIDGKKFHHIISPHTKCKANEYADKIRSNGRNARVIFDHSKTFHTRRYHVYEEKR